MNSRLVRIGIIGAVVALVCAAAIVSGGAAAILKYQREMVHLSRQHIMLVLYSGGPAIVVGVVLGIALTRRSLRRICEPVMQILSIATAIPTLAIIALAMMALGVGKAPALVALFLHALLPIVRNTVEGLRQLPPAEFECAQGMGMTPSQTLFLVELPEALPIIAQGIRVALVINVGVAPLAFLVGGGGLGDLIFSRHRPLRAGDDARRRDSDGRTCRNARFSVVASDEVAGVSRHPQRRRDSRATVIQPKEAK